VSGTNRRILAAACRPVSTWHTHVEEHQVRPQAECLRQVLPGRFPLRPANFEVSATQNFLQPSAHKLVGRLRLGLYMGSWRVDVSILVGRFQAKLIRESL